MEGELEEKSNMQKMQIPPSYKIEPKPRREALNLKTASYSF